MLDDFLPEASWQALLAGVLAQEPRFVPSGTHDARSDYRQSLVLDDGIYLISNDGKFASSFPVEGTHPPFITSITIGGLSGPYSQVGLTTHPLESQLLTSLY